MSSARKISAHYIFDGKGKFIRNGILSIAGDGTIISLEDPGRSEVKELPGLEFYSGIITPGFINAHCHLELSHMKGKIAPGTGMAGFIRSVVTGRKTDPEQIRKAMMRADLEMQKEGIVAVGDVCNREDSFALKAGSEIFYHSFIELFGMENARAAEIFNKGMSLRRKARDEYNIKSDVVPHSAYAVSEELFRIFREEYDDADNILSVHNQETLQEDEFIRYRSGELYDLYKAMGSEKGDSRARGMSPLEYLVQSLPGKPKKLFVHNVHTTGEDLSKANPDPEKAFWVLCPASNQYISGTLPDRLLIDRFPDRVCIGTDSLASNHRLSILHELSLLQQRHPSLTTEYLLQMACINGARALGIDDRYGSFEAGKRPGVVLLRNMGRGFGEAVVGRV